jgi:hypothetical protein
MMDRKGGERERTSGDRGTEFDMGESSSGRYTEDSGRGTIGKM